MSFRNKTVWITGASSGIGAALTRALAEEGATLIISARSVEKLKDIQTSFPDSNIHVVPLDLSKPAMINEVAENVLSQFNHLEYVFHNGGISQRSMSNETAIEVDRKLMEINYFGAVILTKKVLPHFLNQGRGHFIVTSSIVGKFGFPLRSAYSASKHALHGYFESLRAEYEQKGINVTIVCPGRIRTDISMNALDKDGNASKQMDDAQLQGMSADLCARRMLHATLRNKREVLIGGKELIMVYFKRFIPFLFYKIVGKVKPT